MSEQARSLSIRLGVLIAVLAASAAAGAMHQCDHVQQPAHLLGLSNGPNGPQLTSLRTDLSVTMHNGTNSLPVPTGGSAGGAISWAQGLGVPVDAIVEITGNGATTLTGPVGLYGGSTTDGQEYLLGKLNGGNDVVLAGSNSGYAEKVSFVGLFDHLAIGGISGTITPTASKTVTVKVIPISD